MATFYRIVQAHWADTAMTGEGARLHGGRWNPPGLAAVYLAESRALAALEIIVHAPREVLRLDWRILAVEVPDDWIDLPKKTNNGTVPADWRDQPSSLGARRFGEEWLLGKTGVALKLPSVIVPEESALLLNPLHPRMAKLQISAPREFHFDPRL